MKTKTVFGREIKITEGSIFKSLLFYSIPIMLASLLQVLFNSVDIMVLGNFTNESEVAAVGATTSIVGLIVTSFVGLTAGVNVILSRYLGAGNSCGSKKCIDTAIISSVLIGIVLMMAGLFLSRPLLRITECPEGCIDDADLYLKIYFSALPLIMLYNFGATIIRASGDSVAPLLYLGAAGICNVILNVIFCLVLERKVAAVAIATFASQLIGAVCVIIHLARGTGPCRINMKKWSFSSGLLFRMMGIGVPAALNSALFSLSNLQIQSAVNSFGENCMAGNTVSGSVEHLVSSFVGAFGTASVAFIGQNYGAGKKERLDKIVYISLGLAFATALILGNGVNLFSDEIFSIYIPSKIDAISYAKIRASYILVFYWLIALRGVFDSGTSAYGYSIATMISSIVTVLIFRVFWMSTIFPIMPTYECLMQCYIVSWILNLLAGVGCYLVARWRAMKKMSRMYSFDKSEKT